uniref:Peroxisome biogenesis protein 19-1 n=1 Tax=Anthurium amnicola TaxID=1678845 RepID=A0A1D1Z9Q3_9ARAE
MADASSDDLDHLLDSALDDFSKLDLAPGHRGDAAGSGGGGGEGNRIEGEGASVSSSGPVQGLGMGMGLPDPRQLKKKGRQVNRGSSAPPKDRSHASEALAMLTQQAQQTVEGLESTLGAQGQRVVEDLDKEGIVEDFVRQFEEMAGSQDMQSMVETMMQQLLSKEVLHEPMKEIAERYPKWLEEHRHELNPEDNDRYHRQYEFILMLNEVFENDPDNFSKIMELMQKMQECGQPPNDIVQELAPDLDLANLGQISPEMFDSTSNCCIM